MNILLQFEGNICSGSNGEEVDHYPATVPNADLNYQRSAMTGTNSDKPVVYDLATPCAARLCTPSAGIYVQRRPICIPGS